MAALTSRKSVADYAVHETKTIVSRDHSDHTFSGIMFSIVVKEELPVDFLEIEAVAVRGQLGPLTVWVKAGGWELGQHERRSSWKQVYCEEHMPSRRKLVPLKFDEPARVRGGDKISIYIHSALPNDQAIVYDNQRFYVTREDDFMRVTPGLAHLCNEPFGSWHPWGSWRRNREFVGSVSYGVRYILWNPVKHVHQRFNDPFKDLVLLMLLCKPRADCPFSWLSEDCIFYILNMTRYDWVKDSGRGNIIGANQFIALSSARRVSTTLFNAATRGCRAARSLLNYVTI